jgi:hypothetical protein
LGWDEGEKEAKNAEGLISYKQQKEKQRAIGEEERKARKWK